MKAITYHCSECGNEVEEYCPEHPNVDSIATQTPSEIKLEWRDQLLPLTVISPCQLILKKEIRLLPRRKRRGFSY